MLNDINFISISGNLLENAKEITLNNSEYKKYALKVISNDYDFSKKEKRTTTFFVEYFSKVDIKEQLTKGVFVCLTGKMLNPKYSKNGKDIYMWVIHCDTLKIKSKNNTSDSQSNDADNNESMPWE